MPATENRHYLSVYRKFVPMQEQITALEVLYNRTPRRHTAENIKEIISILSEYESLLQSLEGSSLYFEKNTPDLFSNLDTIRQNVKLALSLIHI